MKLASRSRADRFPLSAAATLPNYLLTGLCIETISPESRSHPETSTFMAVLDTARAVPNGGLPMLGFIATLFVAFGAGIFLVHAVEAYFSD